MCCLGHFASPARNCMYMENVSALLGSKPEMKRVMHYLIQDLMLHGHVVWLAKQLQENHARKNQLAVHISQGDFEARTNTAVGHCIPAECWPCCNLFHRKPFLYYCLWRPMGSLLLVAFWDHRFFQLVGLQQTCFVLLPNEFVPGSMKYHINQILELIKA